MESGEQHAYNEPLFRISQKPKLVADNWVLCKSKSHPGLYYYFNRTTGEPIWSTDFEKQRGMKPDVPKRNIHVNHDYPEPQSPPTKQPLPKGFYNNQSTESPGPSHVYNKQIINNKFSKTAYPFSTFGNVTYPNYLPYPMSQQFAFNVPGENYNQIPWAVPANPVTLMGAAPTASSVNQPFNRNEITFNRIIEPITLQSTSMSLSDRFKKSNNQPLSSKITIQNTDNSNSHFGKKFWSNPGSTEVNVFHEEKHKQFCSNDLRLKLVAKRRKSSDTFKRNIEYEQEHNDDSNEKKFEVNEDNIISQMVDFNISYSKSDVDNSLSAPFKKKVMCDLEKLEYALEEEISAENVSGDNPNNCVPSRNIDVTRLKLLAKPHDRKDVWFIVVDTCVLLSNFFFVDILVKSDENCRMMIPYRVNDELESQCSNMCRNLSLRTVAMAQRARRYISEELNKRTVVKAQTALQAGDTKINCPTGDDDILNCCLQLKCQNYHLILLSNDVNLCIKSRVYGIQSATVKDVKKYLSGEEEFLPAPVKITIENDTQEVESNTNCNLPISNISLDRRFSENNNVQISTNDFSFASSLPHKLNIPRHVSINSSISVDNDVYSTSTSAKTQDVECQTSNKILEEIVLKNNKFVGIQTGASRIAGNNNHSATRSANAYDVGCQTSDELLEELMLHKNELFSVKNGTSTVSGNSVIQFHSDYNSHNTNSQFEQFNMTNSRKNEPQIESTIATLPQAQIDPQKNIDKVKIKKREISLKPSITKALNISTADTGKKPYRWRRRNNFVKNTYNTLNIHNTTPEIIDNVSKIVVNDVSKNKLSLQNRDRIDTCEENTQFVKINDISTNRNRHHLEHNTTQGTATNVLKKTDASLQSHAPFDVNANKYNTLVDYNMKNSNQQDGIEGKFINREIVKSGSMRQKNEDNFGEEHFSLKLKNKIIEEKLKVGCDEWLSRYVQIMEEVLTQILQRYPSLPEDKLLSPPWTLHEAVECIKIKYKSNVSVTGPANQLSQLLCQISDKTGKLQSNLNIQQYMNLFDFGFELVEALRAIHTNCEDIEIARKSLSKLLHDIQDPNSLEFDGEVTAAIDTLSDKSSALPSLVVSREDEPSIITPSDSPNHEEKLKSSMKSRISKGISTYSNDVKSDPKNLNFDDKRLTDSEFHHKNNTAAISSLKGKGPDISQPSLTNLKRTLVIHNQNYINPITSRIPEKSTSKSAQTEITSTQPKILRNFSVFPDIEKRLSEKNRDALGLGGSQDLEPEDLDYDYDLEEENGYTNEEYDNENEHGGYISEEYDNENEHDGYINEEYGNENEFESDFVTDEQHQPLQHVNERNREDQADVIVFKKPMDVYKSNEKNIEYKDVEVVITNFLREIRDTFISVYNYCEETQKEIKESSPLSSTRKQDMYKSTNTMYIHLNNLASNLKMILRREIDGVNKDVESLIQRVILEHLDWDGDLTTAYRDIIEKSIEQAAVLVDVLKYMLSMCKVME